MLKSDCLKNTMTPLGEPLMSMKLNIVGKEPFYRYSRTRGRGRQRLFENVAN